MSRLGEHEGKRKTRALAYTDVLELSKNIKDMEREGSREKTEEETEKVGENIVTD